MNPNQALYTDIEHHLLSDEQPSQYLKKISEEPGFREHPFNMLRRLKETPQSPKHHPEGNVWNHTLLVVDEAARVKSKSRDARVFMWAALLHDIGKVGTTKTRGGKITSYDHDKLGARLARRFLSEFTEDAVFIDKAVNLVRWHMQVLFAVSSPSFADIKTMMHETDTEEIALLGLCDRLGRLHADKRAEEENIQLFLQKCNKARV